MDLEFTSKKIDANKETMNTIVIKDIEKLNWKEMSTDDFEKLMKHPVLTQIMVFKMIMERLADKYKEITNLKDQLVDKVILEDPMKSK